MKTVFTTPITCICSPTECLGLIALLKHTCRGHGAPQAARFRGRLCSFSRSTSRDPVPFLRVSAGSPSWLSPSLIVSYYNLYVLEFLRHLRNFFFLPLYMFPKPEVLLITLMTLQLVYPAWIVSLDSRRASHFSSPTQMFHRHPILNMPKTPHSTGNLHLPLVSPISINDLPATKDPSQRSGSHS